MKLEPGETVGRPEHERKRTGHSSCGLSWRTAGSERGARMGPAFGQSETGREAQNLHRPTRFPQRFLRQSKSVGAVVATG
jgi:hypothetical protein